MRRRLILLVAALALGQCDYCQPDPPPHCDPCDPVAMLDQGDLAAAGALAPIADEIAERCGDHEISPALEHRWEKQPCWEYTAHYLVRSLDWDSDLDLQASWDRQAGGSFACTHGQTASGCSAGAPPGGGSIVGPAELQADAASAVALVAFDEELQLPTEAALAQDLPTLVQAVIDDDSCDEIGWVYAHPCTAFLVGDRHMLTAKHCLGVVPEACGGMADNRITNKALVFDYDGHPLSGTTVVEEMTVVACGTLDGEPTVAKEHDWALVELDERPPGNREPLELPAPESGLERCEQIYALGHPIGHPLLRSGTNDLAQPSAWVRSETDFGGAFRVTLDIIYGFSGGPVLSVDGDRLVGLLVSGQFGVSGKTGCDAIFECGAAGCWDENEYGLVVDLAQLHDQLAPFIAG